MQNDRRSVPTAPSRSSRYESRFSKTKAIDGFLDGGKPSRRDGGEDIFVGEWVFRLRATVFYTTFRFGCHHYFFLLFLNLASSRFFLLLPLFCMLFFFYLLSFLCLMCCARRPFGWNPRPSAVIAVRK